MSASKMVGTSMKQQVVGGLVESFFEMLFSNDSQANAQKQQMLAELAQRQAEAERQHKIEEAQRLAAICNRLQATLKLNGLPVLQLKSDEATSSGVGLQLKLGDSSSYQVVNYLKEPLSPPTPPSGSGSLSGGALQVKTGEDDTASMPVASASSAPPAPADSAAPADTVTDARSMTPQQLADLATRVNSLPPAEQQRLMDAAKANAQAANNEAASQSTASATPDKPVMSQLQQIANASQSAATAQNLNDAAAQARVGFDQAIHVAPGSVTSQTRPSSSAPSSSQTTISAKAPVSGAVSGSVYSSVSTVDLRTSDPQKPMVVKQLSTGTPGRAPGCPIDSTKRLPTREELAQELAGLRFRLDVLKNSLLRLNRSIQMDQRQFVVWEKETQDAVDRSKEQLKQAIADRVEGKFFDYAKEYYHNSPDKLNAVKNVEVLLKENDVYDWADKGDGTWEQFAEGSSLLGDNLPITEDAKDILWASKNMIDSAFDIATELVSWRRISQLRKNSDEYLFAVKQSGEQMKQIVGRIRGIEDRLASGSYAAENKAPQAGAAVCDE